MCPEGTRRLVCVARAKNFSEADEKTSGGLTSTALLSRQQPLTEALNDLFRHIEVRAAQLRQGRFKVEQAGQVRGAENTERARYRQATVLRFRATIVFVHQQGVCADRDR